MGSRLDNGISKYCRKVLEEPVSPAQRTVRQGTGCTEQSVLSSVNQNGRDRILNSWKHAESICGLHTSLLFSKNLRLLIFGVAACSRQALQARPCPTNLAFVQSRAHRDRPTAGDCPDLAAWSRRLPSWPAWVSPLAFLAT